MGNLEKLVLLAVLFVAAIVVAISLNRGPESVDAAGPLDAAQKVLEGESVAQGELPEALLPPATPAASESTASSLLLNAGEERGEQPAAAFPAQEKTGTLTLEPKSDPNQRILRDSLGLRPSFLEEYMVYTAGQGDTWSSLAQRFYQDGRFTRNLQVANEGLQEPTAGTDVLIPVFDFLTVDAGLQPGDSLARETSPEKPLDTAPADVLPKTTPDVGKSPTLEYVVQSGDTLSDISLAVFGTATRWKELLDANHDVLQKPEGLQVGMKLKIPPGGKLPAAKAKAETKPADPKGKTAQSSTTPKKKKVL